MGGEGGEGGGAGLFRDSPEGAAYWGFCPSSPCTPLARSPPSDPSSAPGRQARGASLRGYSGFRWRGGGVVVSFLIRSVMCGRLRTWAVPSEVKRIQRHRWNCTKEKASKGGARSPLLMRPFLKLFVQFRKFATHEDENKQRQKSSQAEEWSTTIVTK